MSARSILAAVAAAVVAFIAAVWLMSRAQTPPPAPPPTVTATPRPTIAPATPTATATVAAPTVTRILATVHPVAAGSPAAGATSASPQATPTPGSYSMAITDGLDPIQQQRSVQVGKSHGRDSRNPRLVTFPSTSSYEAPNPMLLYAYLAQDVERENENGEKETIEDSQRVPAREITGELRKPNGQVVAELTFHDDGKDGDAQAGDDMFTVQYEPTPEGAVDLAGRLTVAVRATSVKGEQRAATTSVLYSVTGARLTGEYRDAIVDGDLRIEAEVEVEDAGTYDLQATLADEQAKFMAWAHTTVHLEPGTHWVALTYAGSIVRAHKVDGPYTVWSLALENASTDPPVQNDVVANAHRTQPYRVDQFAAGPSH